MNGAAYSNSQLDAQSAKADATIDIDKRANALRHLNDMVMKHVAVIPLHYQENDYAVRKDRDINFVPRPDNYLVFQNMSVGSQ